MRLRAAAALALAAVALAPGQPGKGKGPASTKPSSLLTLPPTLLDGRPFPQVSPYSPPQAPARRSLFVNAGGAEGDGSEALPFNDLQKALCRLGPGDRLRVGPGTYPGPLVIGPDCQDGTESNPIQVAFDARSVVRGSGGGSAALSVRRAFWRMERLTVDAGEEEASGVLIGSAHVAMDRVRITGGRGPGLVVEGTASYVTISNARIDKERVRQAGASSYGIQVAAGARDVLVTNSRLHHNPGGSIRVEDGRPGVEPAQSLIFSANSIHDDGGPAIDVEAGRFVRIQRNTIVATPGEKTSRGVVLGKVRDARIEGNEIANCALAIEVGQATPDGKPVSAVDGAWIVRNRVESQVSSGAGVAVEAGRDVRVVNNVLQHLTEGILVLGKPPSTGAVTVVNNLLIEISEVSFALSDAKAASVFDYNVFSPRGSSLAAVIGKTTQDLGSFLTKGSMPHTQVVSGVALQHRDLARVSGVETVDRGLPVDGLEFLGKAPDIGVAER